MTNFHLPLLEATFAHPNGFTLMELLIVMAIIRS